MVGGLYLKEPPIRHRVSSIYSEVEEGVLKLVGVGKRRPESDATGAAKAQLAAQLAGEDGNHLRDRRWGGWAERFTAEWGGSNGHCRGLVQYNLTVATAGIRSPVTISPIGIAASASTDIGSNFFVTRTRSLKLLKLITVADDGLDEVVAALRNFALVEHETVPDERNPVITTETIRLQIAGIENLEALLKPLYKIVEDRASRSATNRWPTNCPSSCSLPERPCIHFR